MKLYYIIILMTAGLLVTACNNNGPSDPNTPRVINEVEKAASEVKDAADEIKDAANSINEAKDALTIPK
jgi:hypothetical protein